MDVAQNFKGDSIGSGPMEAASSLDAGPVSDDSDQAERSSQSTILAINAFSAALAVGTGFLLLRGPLHGAAPIRQLLPQPEMFVILCAMWAAAAWAPVSLHYRGNTYLFVLEEVPMLLGLVFLSPTLLVVCAVCAETFVRGGASPATGVKAPVQRHVGCVEHRAWPPSSTASCSGPSAR